MTAFDNCAWLMPVFDEPLLLEFRAGWLLKEGPSRPERVAERAPERVAERAPEQKEKRTGNQGRPIVCVQCSRIVTASDAKIEVNGRHAHVCVNPHGIVYEIGCFESAPGCVPQGQVSGQWTWFPGYSWQVVLCAGCLLHLGWLFRGSDGAFHGLILKRIQEQQPDQGD